VPCGDTVRILSDDGEWCHVQRRKKTGYMMREFLRIESGALYTFEIPHLTFDQASALMSYPGATMTEERG
jgi:hypothetical protein